jgi:hypothetical protein
VGGISQIVVAFEDGQRKLTALKAPDLPAIKSQYESSKKILAIRIASLQDLQSGLTSDSPTASAQAYTAFLEANGQAAAVHRDIESLMAKYNITDTEVNYRFRGKQ